MKNSKKSLLLSVTALILCCALLAGTTLAWFTDSVSSGVNTITAGNLDIEVLHTNARGATEKIDGRTNLFTDTDGNAMNWEPGAVSYETFTVKNEGSLALKYKLAMNILDYNALNSHTLKEVLKVKVLSGSHKLSTIDRTTVSALDWNTTDTLDAFNTSGSLYPNGSLTGPAEEEFQVIVYWQPREDDNNWNVNNGETTTDGQPLFINFGINVVASQLNHENDSFGPDYDQGIALPDLPVSVNKTFQSAPITTETVTQSVEVKNASTNAGVATVPAASVNAVIEALKAQAANIAPDSPLSTVIYLDVETGDKTETSVTYNIDLSAKLTYTDTNGDSQTTTLNSLDGNLADQIVTASMEIGKGLSNVTVKHSGVAMTQLTSENANEEGYYYNKTTGVLTIKSSSFSPFTVDYTIEGVAAVGNTTYSTLEDAIAAAKDGDTITLLKDVDATVSKDAKVAFTLDKNVTLNGNGRTITVTGDSNKDTFAIQSTNSGAIKNLKLNVKGVERAIRLDGNGTYSVSSTTVTGTGVGIHVKGAAAVDLNKVDVTINAAEAFTAHKRSGIMVGAAANVTITDSNVNVITSDKTNNTHTWGKGLYVGVEAKGHIDVNNTNVKADYAIAIDGSSDPKNLNSITINSGTFTGKAGSPGGYSYKEVIIRGGTFNDFGIAEHGFNNTTDPVARMIIDGGTFSEDPTGYLKKDYVAKQVGNVYKVYNAHLVIATADELFAFAAAVNGGNNFAGKKVILISDIDLNNAAWTPIGSSGSVASYPNNTFSGTFDGQDHTISNLKVDVDGAWASAGLFGTANRATIKNVIIDGADIKSTHYAGGILGYDTETTVISNCTVKNSNIVSATEKSTGSWDNGDKVGGIVGYMNVADIQNCAVTGTTIQGYRDLGGIAGYIGGGTVSGCSIENVTITVDNTNNYKNYQASTAYDANDIIGENKGTVTACTGTATINRPVFE